MGNTVPSENALCNKELLIKQKMQSNRELIKYIEDANKPIFFGKTLDDAIIFIYKQFNMSDNYSHKHFSKCIVMFEKTLGLDKQSYGELLTIINKESIDKKLDNRIKQLIKCIYGYPNYKIYDTFVKIIYLLKGFLLYRSKQFSIIMKQEYEVGHELLMCGSEFDLRYCKFINDTYDSSTISNNVTVGKYYNGLIYTDGLGTGPKSLLHFVYENHDYGFIIGASDGKFIDLEVESQQYNKSPSLNDKSQSQNDVDSLMISVLAKLLQTIFKLSL